MRSFDVLLAPANPGCNKPKNIVDRGLSIRYSYPPSMAPDNLPSAGVPVIDSRVIACRGVRYLADKEDAVLRAQIRQWDEDARLPGLAGLPALPAENTVPAVITVFRNGLQRVSCPFFKEDDRTCAALLETALKGKASLADHFFDGKVNLPKCSFHREPGSEPAVPET